LKPANGLWLKEVSQREKDNTGNGQTLAAGAGTSGVKFITGMAVIVSVYPCFRDS